MRPPGGSRPRDHCSPGTHSSGVRFWNLTASAPERQAASIIRLASSREPLWLIPISAITKIGSPSPTRRLPTCTMARVALLVMLLIDPPPLSPPHVGGGGVQTPHHCQPLSPPHVGGGGVQTPQPHGAPRRRRIHSANSRNAPKPPRASQR